MEEKLLALLERLAQAERALLTREAHRLGLTATQAHLLLHLAERPQGVVDLAALFALTPATVSEALAALERKGLLRREKDEKDRRRWRLKPTKEGQALAQARTLAAQVAAMPPVPVRMAKRAINASATALDNAVSHMDADQFLLTQGTEDALEGAMAFFEKRPPRFTGN